jgi:flagellar M-ring protein FliF
VLDRAFGPGEAIASVDVALNLDQSKVTTEEVLPAKGGAGADGNPAGVVVRERYTLRDGEPVAADLAKPGAAATTTGESDFQVGRRVEQLAVASGTVRRMTVAVVVRQALSAQQLDKLTEVVSLAVGLNSARGDAIVVNSLDMLSGVRADAQPAVEAGVPAAAAARAQSAAASAMPDPASVRVVGWVVAGLLASIAALAGVAWRRSRRRVQPARLVLSEAARQQMLASVRQWIEAPVETTSATGVRK